MKQNNKKKRKKIIFISILICLFIISLILYLLPWVANHFSFALPRQKGLPYRISYNGRDYDTIASCAYAHWCERENLVYKRNRDKELCMKVSDIKQSKEWTLTQVSTLWTLAGSSHPIMIPSYVLEKP